MKENITTLYGTVNIISYNGETLDNYEKESTVVGFIDNEEAFLKFSGTFLSYNHGNEFDKEFIILKNCEYEEISVEEYEYMAMQKMLTALKEYCTDNKIKEYFLEVSIFDYRKDSIYGYNKVVAKVHDDIGDLDKIKVTFRTYRGKCKIETKTKNSEYFYTKEFV